MSVPNRGMRFLMEGMTDEAIPEDGLRSHHPMAIPGDQSLVNPLFAIPTAILIIFCMQGSA